MTHSTKSQQLRQRMYWLGIRESDLRERFVRASGAGGQKVNKTSSCVWLLHEPTGVAVKCQRSRSQAGNRFHARALLCDKLEGELRGEARRIEQSREKIRRQKRRRSKRAKEKMLANKRVQGQKKVLRRRPMPEL